MKTVNNAEIETLRSLLADWNATTKDLTGLDEIETKLKGERAALVRTGKMDDEKTLSKISTVQTKIEMVPFRRERLGDVLSEIEEKLWAAIGAPQRILNELFEEVYLCELENIEGNLSFLGVGETDLRLMSVKVLEKTAKQIPLKNIDLLRHSQSGTAMERATTILSGFDMIENFQRRFPKPEGDGIKTALVS